MSDGKFGVLFVLGPSGVGKTDLGDEIAAQLGFLHYDADAGAARGIASVIVEMALLCKKAQEEHSSGVVLTFPSGFLPSSNDLLRLRPMGVQTAILYASAERCLAAFVEREKQNGRGLPAQHWIDNNSNHGQFGQPDYTEFRVETFDRDRWRTKDEVLDEVRARFLM